MLLADGRSRCTGFAAWRQLKNLATRRLRQFLGLRCRGWHQRSAPPDSLSHRRLDDHGGPLSVELLMVLDFSGTSADHAVALGAPMGSAPGGCAGPRRCVRSARTCLPALPCRPHPSARWSSVSPCPGPEPRMAGDHPLRCRQRNAHDRLRHASVGALQSGRLRQCDGPARPASPLYSGKLGGPYGSGSPRPAIPGQCGASDWSLGGGGG